MLLNHDLISLLYLLALLFSYVVLIKAYSAINQSLWITATVTRQNLTMEQQFGEKGREMTSSITPP